MPSRSESISNEDGKVKCPGNQCHSSLWRRGALSPQRIPGLLQVLELTQGQTVEVEILAVLVQAMQDSRQQHGMQGTDAPGRPQLWQPCLFIWTFYRMKIVEQDYVGGGQSAMT